MTQEEQEKVALLEAKCQALQLRLDTVTETLEFTKELKQQADRLELIARKGNEELMGVLAAKDKKIQELNTEISRSKQWATTLWESNLKLKADISAIEKSKLAKAYAESRAENKELKAKLRDVQQLLEPKKERKSK